MSRLINAGNKFRAKYKTVDGREFYGQILEPPDTSRVSNFLSARRYLRTRPITIVKPRDVVVIAGTKYLCAEHGLGFYVTPIYRHFKLFEIDMEAQAVRSQRITNPITGVKDTVRNIPLGKVYISLQPKASEEDGILIPSIMKVGIADKPLKVEDRVGDYIVTKADTVLGVTLVELKEV